MNRFDELVNDHTRMGDSGEVIFSSYDHLLEFVQEIRADEREACAKVLDQMQANDRWSNYYGVAASAIRARGEA